MRICVIHFCLVVNLLVNKTVCDNAFEGDFKLDASIAVALEAGTQEKPVIVSTRTIRFVQVHGRLEAALSIEYVSGPKFKWRTRIELLNENGEVLGQAQLTGKNSGITWGTPVPVEHDQRFSFGQLKDLSEARRFRISITAVERESGDESASRQVEQKYNTFYGKVLFEDGSPAVVKPALWTSAATSVTIRPYPENCRYHLYTGIREKNGLFSLYLPDEILESLRSGERRIAISCPCHDDEGGRIFRQVGTFPFELLVPEVSQARAVRVKRPEEVRGAATSYASGWAGYEHYQRMLLERHEERYAADARKIAERIEWGLSQSGLRCKLVPAGADILKGDPLFFLIYLQNVSKDTLRIDSHFRRHINFYLNGRSVGQEVYLYEPFTFEQSPGVSDCVAVEPGEILTGALPVGNLATFDFALIGNGVGCAVAIDNTGNPGTYRVYAVYDQRRSAGRDGWWKGKVTSNEIVINVHPRDRDVYGGEFALDRDIPLILFIGSQNNPYLVKADFIRFEKTGNNASASLRLSLRTTPILGWQIELEMVSADGEVLYKKKVIENNRGKAHIIDRDVRFPPGPWRSVSTAKKFRVSFSTIK